MNVKNCENRIKIEVDSQTLNNFKPFATIGQTGQTSNTKQARVNIVIMSDKREYAIGAIKFVLNRDTHRKTGWSYQPWFTRVALNASTALQSDVSCVENKTVILCEITGGKVHPHLP
jgi:hypothetical protein